MTEWLLFYTSQSVFEKIMMVIWPSFVCVILINWWKGKPSGSIACTRKQQPRFYWSCSSVVINDARPLTCPSARAELHFQMQTCTLPDPWGPEKQHEKVTHIDGLLHVKPGNVPCLLLWQLHNLRHKLLKTQHHTTWGFCLCYLCIITIHRIVLNLFLTLQLLSFMLMKSNSYYIIFLCSRR